MQLAVAKLRHAWPLLLIALFVLRPVGLGNLRRSFWICSVRPVAVRATEWHLVTVVRVAMLGLAVVAVPHVVRWVRAMAQELVAVARSIALVTLQEESCRRFGLRRKRAI